MWKERFDPADYLHATDGRGRPLEEYFDPRIRGFENAPYRIPPNTEWVYYVQVCGFTFIFYSLAMIREYLDYYERKNLPARREKIMWAHHDYEQNPFTRLPLYLREEPKRLKVVEALKRALDAFGSGDRRVRTYDRRRH
jgi:hypothetical protein